MPNIEVTTKRCLVCRKNSIMKLDKDSYDRWQSGMYVQTAFPRMSPDDRELLISGTHSKCWDARFGDDD
jgi:hypothetical protein